MDGTADVAETTYTPFQSEPDAAPVRLIVRRVQPTLGSQLALFVTYSYHGITDREGETLELEADHRRHAEIENAIRDLKYGVGLNHLPSGRLAANAAWLAVQVMAHNLARWTARIGLGEQIVTTKTLQRRFFSMAGRRRRRRIHSPGNPSSPPTRTNSVREGHFLPTAYRSRPPWPPGRHHRASVAALRRPHPHLLESGQARSPSLTHHPWYQRQGRLASVDSG